MSTTVPGHLQAARQDPRVCAALVAVMGVGGFALDHVNTLSTQSLFGVVAFVALAGVLATVPPRVRVQACLMGAMATVTEILFSSAWGMYGYRLENIPSFVPCGHALVFTCVWRLASRDAPDGRLPRLPMPPGLTALVVVVPAALLAVHPHDAFGLVCLAVWAALFGLLPTHRRFLAFMFLAVLLVEVSGTQVSAWRWAGAAPGTGLTMGNPPVGIAAVYCLLDLAGLWGGARLHEAWTRRAG